MAETRRGTAMLLLTAGDEQISSALASGIMAVRGTGDLIRLDAERRATCPWDCRPRLAENSPPDCFPGARRPIGGRLGEAKPLTHDEAQVVSAEMDRQKVAELLRVAMHREPVDYAGLAYDAEVAYGESLYAPGLLGKIGEKLLVGYALIVLAFDRLFESVRG